MNEITLTTTRIPASPCPSCGAVQDAATGFAPGRTAPQPGDITVCADCGVILAFDNGLYLRAVSKAEVDQLDPASRRMVDRLAAFFKRPRLL